jgi:hypothetical protein
MPSPSSKSSQHEKKLLQHLEQLNSNLHKQLSFKRSFLQAMLNGVGTAIGATIIAGIVIAILSATINSIHDVPVLNKIIESTGLEQSLQQR